MGKATRVETVEEIKDPSEHVATSIIPPALLFLLFSSMFDIIFNDIHDNQTRCSWDCTTNAVVTELVIVCLKYILNVAIPQRFELES